MISVIIPVYNSMPYLRRCLHSIMAQTYTDLEIICVDDGSTDGSGKLLDTFASIDSRIRVIHQNNFGASAARNAGIEIATGEFITFVDSDDAIELDMYEILLPYFSDENVDVVHCGYKRIHSDGSVKDVNGTGKIVYQSKYEAADCLISGRLFVGSLWNKLFRSELFHSIRLDTQLVINEDVLALAELYNQTNTSIYLDIGKYLFFERSSSVTSTTKQQKIILDSLTVAERMCEIYKSTPVEQAAEKRVLNARIGLYRWYVMSAPSNRQRELDALTKRIVPVLNARKDISFRQRANYTLMRRMPTLYRIAYTIYDNIRIPNWDVE